VEEKTGIPSGFFDERLCTVEAEGLLDRAGYSKKKKKQRLDIVSAQIMLQSYMQASRVQP
jgi:putative Holliday junction resolvase